MEIQQSGGLERNGYPGQAFSFDKEGTESGDQAIRNPEIWGTDVPSETQPPSDPESTDLTAAELQKSFESDRPA